VVTGPSSELTIETNITDPTDGTNGSVDLTVTGGAAPYTFQWSNGSTNEDLVDLQDGEYSVIVTDANGCSIQVDVLVGKTVTGLNDMEEDLLSYYPNPTKSFLNIELNLSNPSGITIEMVDLTGKLILVKEFEELKYLNYRLDVSGFVSGVYFLQIRTKYSRHVERISLVR